MVSEESSTGGQRPEFAESLRNAINGRKVTLTWLRERLTASGNPVSAATLSYWRSGARRPEGPQSMAAVEEIESLLGLDAGTLIALIGPSYRVGPMTAPLFPLEEAKMEAAVAESFAALGAPHLETARDVSTQSITDVGADGFVISRTTRTLIQSMSGTITEVPYLELTPGVSTPPPTFRAIAGAKIVRSYSHPSGEVHGVMFEFERPLAPAQTQMLEWVLEFPPGYPGTRETGHGVSRPCRELLLWTRFHPDAVPDWAEEMVESPTGTMYAPMDLDGLTSVHQVRRNFGPGMLVLRWGYGERPD